MYRLTVNKIIRGHLRVLNRLLSYRSRPRGGPSRIWLRTIKLDSQRHTFYLNSAWNRAQNRANWRKLVETAA